MVGTGDTSWPATDGGRTIVKSPENAAAHILNLANQSQHSARWWGRLISLQSEHYQFVIGNCLALWPLVCCGAEQSRAQHMTGIDRGV